jgi:acyl-coenzyme A synthetase/AMP-(fatty) acid ligase
MKMPPDHVMSLRDSLSNASDCLGRFLWGARAEAPLSALAHGTSLGGWLRDLAGRSVLLATQDQLATALALIELDGVARRLIVCPPDLSAEHLPSVITKAGVEAIVSDRDLSSQRGLGVPLHVACSARITPAGRPDLDRYPTEWVLFTSGTSGAPKMLVHSLAGLTAPIKGGQNRETDVVWGTFYDLRRYGGLQIFLRAVLGHGSFVLSSTDEPLANHLARLGAHEVTHISGTPSHWRRVLMSGSARAIGPRYIRLSGEIADQAILNSLRSFYPEAAIGHAFASTEAGVAFEVTDGLAGFPEALVGSAGEVEMKIADGSLRIRSARTAVGYLGDETSALKDDEGFVDTGDVVERRGDRYYFLGRRSGIINVGGLKVYPEEVEAVINRHPAVRGSRVRPRRSSITGCLVVAEVVLRAEPDLSFKREILQLCRSSLPAHKVPAMIHFVPALDLATAGKLARGYA